MYSVAAVVKNSIAGACLCDGSVDACSSQGAATDVAVRLRIQVAHYSL